MHPIYKAASILPTNRGSQARIPVAFRAGELSREALTGEIPAPDIYYAALMAGPEFFSDPRTAATAALSGSATASSVATSTGLA